MEEFTVEVNAKGEYTENELREWLNHLLGGCSISDDNPFYNEDQDAEISDIQLY